MTPIQWNTVVPNMAITSQPMGLWTPVVEYLPGGARVRVIARGNWSYSAQMPACGPDGHRVSFITPQRCLSKDVAVGALICKIGGGTADVKGTIIPVGSLAIFDVPEAGGGGLFMTINDEIGGFDDNSGEVRVWVGLRLSGTAGA